ncbi:MAG: hypothetical protein ACYSWP_09055 [Planctomycetota bacterium]|jgi:hypothetical protein
MVSESQITTEANRLREELASINGDILGRFSLEDYLKDVLKPTGYRKRCLYSKKQIQIFSTITNEYGSAALALYHKIGLCHFMCYSLKCLNSLNMPDNIIDLIHTWFEGVMKDFSSQPDDYYIYHSYNFHTDVKVCTLKSIPVGGAWYVDPEPVGFRPLIYGGFIQSLAYIKCLLCTVGGFDPFYIIHTSPRGLGSFNKHEMDLAYLRMAELMKRNPRVKGIYRRSWFLDPAVENISPQLAYIREVPRKNGARFFKTKTRQIDIEYAIAMSSKRRQLYKKGQYLPEGYVYIWPRKAFLDWASRNKGLLAIPGTT